MTERNRAILNSLGAEIRSLNAELSELHDFVRNIAGLDDRQLLNPAIITQWRDDARALLNKVGEKHD